MVTSQLPAAYLAAESSAHVYIKMHQLVETRVHNRAAMPSKIPVRVQEPSYVRRRESAPSKLEQLAAEYRKKLYREKLKKLTHPYQNDSDHVVYETRGYGSAGNDGRQGKHGLMREFFRERHALEEGHTNNRLYHGNIKYHYQKKKNEFYREVSPGKPPLPQNRSAGRDRSKPLAPINRPTPGKQILNGDEPANGMTHSPKPPLAIKPQFVRNHHSRSNSSGSNSPQFDLANLPADKALIPIGPKAKPIPAISSHGSDQEYSDGGGGLQSPGFGSGRQVNSVPQRNNSTEKLKRPQVIRRHSPQILRKQMIASSPTSNKPEKLSSYQKWQMEQDNARKERLRQYRQQQKTAIKLEDNGFESDVSSGQMPSSRQIDPSISRPPSGKIKKKKTLILKKTKPPSSDEDEEVDEEQAELLRKQAELEALIEKQKHELEEMRRQRLIDEENERRAREKRQKRLAAEAQRAKRQPQTEERTHSHLSHHQSSQQDIANEDEIGVFSQQDGHPEEPELQSPVLAPAQPSIPRKRRNSLPKKKKHEEVRREPTPNNENTAFYLQMAATEDAIDEVVLKPCTICGRKFAEDRLLKHMNVCQKAGKKRKVFDPMKMRIQGTELEQYARHAAKAKREKTPPKKTWRVQHENFIKSIRYAKKVTAVELAGGNVADLPPPPPTQNPDYKQCPYCERSFNPSAAERHIPRCKDIKSRPAPPRQRRR